MILRIISGNIYENIRGISTFCNFTLQVVSLGYNLPSFLGGKPKNQKRGDTHDTEKQVLVVEDNRLNRLLLELADLARELAGEEGVCGRFSADRFMVLRERSREQADRDLLSPEHRVHCPLARSNLVIKWGVYEIRDRSVPVLQMCDRAFLAADSIKSQYNRSLAVHDDTLREKLLREQAITESMETALNEGQFTVYLQPKYCLHDDRLSGAEALVRWIHPEWGFMSPGEFIPLFEKNGFITQLDRYVWEQVCILLRFWHQKGYPEISVSVNVSRADVYQDDIPETLSGLTAKYGIKPQQLHLELTESAYTENPGQIISTVNRLRQLEEEASQDFLTKLYNRRGLDSAVAGLRKADMPVALYLFDLDNLKDINDQLGHDAGDALLRSFAEVLNRSTRSTDVLCRYGGDEFVVVLRRIGSKETVLKKGEAICREFHAVQLRNGIQASCSCGIAMSDQEELPFAQLLEQADQALYQAKQEGKSTCRLWEAE